MKGLPRSRGWGTPAPWPRLPTPMGVLGGAGEGPCSHRGVTSLSRAFFFPSFFLCFGPNNSLAVCTSSFLSVPRKRHVLEQGSVGTTALTPDFEAETQSSKVFPSLGTRDLGEEDDAQSHGSFLVVVPATRSRVCPLGLGSPRGGQESVHRLSALSHAGGLRGPCAPARAFAGIGEDVSSPAAEQPSRRFGSSGQLVRPLFSPLSLDCPAGRGAVGRT